MAAEVRAAAEAKARRRACGAEAQAPPPRRRSGAGGGRALRCADVARGEAEIVARRAALEGGRRRRVATAKARAEGRGDGGGVSAVLAAADEKPRRRRAPRRSKRSGPSTLRGSRPRRRRRRRACAAERAKASWRGGRRERGAGAGARGGEGARGAAPARLKAQQEKTRLAKEKADREKAALEPGAERAARGGGGGGALARWRAGSALGAGGGGRMGRDVEPRSARSTDAADGGGGGASLSAAATVGGVARCGRAEDAIQTARGEGPCTPRVTCRAARARRRRRARRAPAAEPPRRPSLKRRSASTEPPAKPTSAILLEMGHRYASPGHERHARAGTARRSSRARGVGGARRRAARRTSRAASPTLRRCSRSSPPSSCPRSARRGRAHACSRPAHAAAPRRLQRVCPHREARPRPPTAAVSCRAPERVAAGDVVGGGVADGSPIMAGWAVQRSRSAHRAPQVQEELEGAVLARSDPARAGAPARAAAHARRAAARLARGDRAGRGLQRFRRWLLAERPSQRRRCKQSLLREEAPETLAGGARLRCAGRQPRVEFREGAAAADIATARRHQGASRLPRVAPPDLARRRQYLRRVALSRVEISCSRRQ